MTVSLRLVRPSKESDLNPMSWEINTFSGLLRKQGRPDQISV